MMRSSLPGTARRCIAIAHDAMMAAFSFVLALYLRLGDEQFHFSRPYLLLGMLTFTAIAVAVFCGMRLYRGLWRYASLPDMVALVKAASVAILLFYGVVLFSTTRLEGVPRSVPFIQWLLLLALLGGPRFLYRAIKDRTLRFDFRHDASKQIPLLLVGATDGAELFIRNCQRDAACAWRVVGLLDDAPEKKNLTIHNVPIFGNTEALQSTVARLERGDLKPQRVILCDELEAKKMSALLEETEKLGLTLGRLPSMSELRHGAVDRPEIRAVAIEDLLGRAQNVHDREAMRTLVAGKCVAITGAGGSIGSELCRQVAALKPSKLLLIELGEHALYQIDMELQEIAPAIPRRAVLADVQQRGQMHNLFSEFRPQIVFHAAAIKHVPLSEANPLAAIETNVLGTKIVAEAASAHGAAVMVLVSTDKAVNPTNVMGATKKLAENWLQSMDSASGTRFVTVRFGNVLGSTGSVVPLFRRQLERGGPITVTHPDMVRYFMTIREAVELVIQSACLGAALEKQRKAVFVLDMGKPVRITDLATQMIRLAGLKPGRDIEIVYTGLRPGEKLFEELFYDAEQVQRTEYPGILIASVPPPDAEVLKKLLDQMSDLCKQRNAEDAVRLLRVLVPEFQLPQKVAA